jgi:protocatechuate 3,4-dioxygenase alpha subunit
MRTPSQTVGPFLHIGLLDSYGPELVPPGTPGALQVHGRVLDGAGEPVLDALVELWHPDVGFGRSDTRDGGRFAFVVVRAPHFDVAVFARGLLKQVVTRMYLSDEPFDAVLAAVDPERRRTLVAVPEGPGVLLFDIHLQGPDETVFFEL